MIPPSLLNIGYYFALLPVYEQQPAVPAASDSPSSSDGGEPDSGACAPATTEGAVGADADGINDQVALRMVLKGYKLTAVRQWEALANPGYEHFIETRDDDSDERQRQDQRARSIVRPNPQPGHDTVDPAGAAPTAPSDPE